VNSQKITGSLHQDTAITVTISPEAAGGFNEWLTAPC
jgi:hypothetical protein